MDGRRAPIPWLAIALLSGTALAYEVLLTRIFALIHWHHLAATIISLALLGYGASGSFLSLLQGRLQQRFATLFVLNALLFAISMMASLGAAGRIALDPLAFAWELGQWGKLATIFLLMAIPFFAVANCIGLALWRYRAEVHRIYAVDLAGAGLGPPLLIGLLTQLAPGRVLTVLVALAALAAVLAAWTLGWRRSALALLALGALAWPSLPSERLAQPAPYKDLARALTVQGAEVDAELSGPHGVVTVVRNDHVPIRQAPGLPLLPKALPPEQRALFIDGDRAGTLVRFDGAQAPAYLRELGSAWPYAVLASPRVLVLDAGGGEGVLQALAHRAAAVHAVEWRSELLTLMGTRLNDFSGDLLRHPAVQWHPATARAFLARTRQRFDLIRINAPGDRAGLGAQRAHYGLTVEAFVAALAHLAPGGVITVSTDTRQPPRASLRLAATAIAALNRAGSVQPARHLAALRSWRQFTLLASRDPLSAEQIAALRAFAVERGFDPVWLPGMERDEANRFHRLATPVFHDGVRALLGARADDFVSGYPFRIDPASDERPFAMHFVRAAELPEWWRMAAGRGLGQIEWGVVAAMATLGVAVLAGGALILLPLLLSRRLRTAASGPRWRVPLYFGLVGLAFLPIEIVCLQRFTLVLGSPTQAVALVLASFLVFAAAGARYSRGWSGARIAAGLRIAVTAIVAMLALHLLLMPTLLPAIGALPPPMHAIACLALLAPLAFAMGMPFPLGLARLGADARVLLPWAWGANGCASVIGAAAAPLLAMALGFGGVLLAAAALYLLALILLPAAGPITSE